MFNTRSKKTLSALVFFTVSSIFLASCTKSTHTINEITTFGSQQDSPLLSSPNQNVTSKVFVDPQGSLQYVVYLQGKLVVKPSALGITVDGVDLANHAQLLDVKQTTVNETYPTRGNHTVANNHYNQWLYFLQHKNSQKQFQIALRLYDDGAAYRYIVPSNDKQHVDGESSSWTLPDHSKTWFFERDSDWKLKTYAGWWKAEDVKDMPTTSKQGPIQGTPLVFELPNSNGYAAITKAALYNYSGMRLKAVGDNTFKANFTEGEKGFDVNGTITSPWRVVMLGKDLDTLVNSDLISNLNPAPDPKLFADTDYIQPGRSVWSWMSMRLGTINDQKDFTRYAAELGFEYNLIDAGWKDWPTPWKTLKDITLQGKKLGVENWVWVHSEDIDDPTNNYYEMREYLDKVKAAGAIGVKTDFMNSESKLLIDFEIAFLQETARRQLLANFHGSHSPTGESRTYPNELTREGIRGIEVNLHNKHLPPSHNAALPFTRFLLGHGDYTPLSFTNPGATTFAHQLATIIVFLSPVQVYADSPVVLQHNPDIKPMLQIIKDTPTVWDETKVLSGSKIGELAAFARRSGDKWFIGILNDETAKNYELDLSFIGKGKFTAQIAEDDLQASKVDINGLNPLAIGELGGYNQVTPAKVHRVEVNQHSKLTIRLANGGGFAALIAPN
ncbi:glycoside hydrolase family 97 N-terminal domain-containing protein [Paraglaciecola aquimarina]|uniref:Glycoside hydrolase family 97 N-terminal domain-containing protein n=1 Tax=Paraglaciecola aquimarina TaxID=1235557 RepID=A0ABU3SZ54_9ALTE|nr:glycoside hydrolase family 97 N-terminal domain-containing protein [Paraglaciecola aquimarina]MDU0355294.1 glycoside hydrolase family 97 N-terminal domain-containing protein [Paraglaciecola aquimarina]